MRSPIRNGKINVPFGKRGRLWSWLGYHTGVDIIVPTGTPILGTSTQKVIRADHNGGSYGRWVAAQDTAGRIHIYAHMSRIATKVGATIKDGTVIGYVGSTGNSTGPHLHYEVRSGKANHHGRWGSPVSPTAWCK